jgi:hypothetical protein
LSRKLLSNEQPKIVARAHRLGPAPWTTAKAHTFGEFRGQARYICAAHDAAELPRVDGIGDTNTDAEDNELASVLAAIAEEVHRFASAASAAIVVEFAARKGHARASLPRGQIPGALQALKDARAAALAIIKRNAAAELASRREVAVRMHRARIRAVRNEHRRLHGKPPSGLDRK